MSNGYRWLIIDEGCFLEYSYNNVVIVRDDSKTVIPINNIAVILINSLQVTITTFLLNELNKNNIVVVICDEKQNPAVEVIGLFNNVYSSGKIREQIAWTVSAKKLMWKKIVKAKISMQINLLKNLELSYNVALDDYLSDVKSGDKTNREGQASRVYFNTLFGSDFTRDLECDVNYALNYGYAILASYISRLLVIHGYQTLLGINHCSITNKLNLTYDLIEVFRPLIDEFVYRNKNRVMDTVYKKELVALMRIVIKYKKRNTILQDAIDMFIIEVLGNVGKAKFVLPKIKFYE